MAAPDQHTAAYEARFQRELVANFAGGLARESLRRKAIQSGAQSSLFDATACHRAELEAAQSDMTKTERLRAAAEAANVARADREAQRLFDREAAGLPEFDGDDNQGMVRDGDLVSGSGAAPPTVARPPLDLNLNLSLGVTHATARSNCSLSSPIFRIITLASYAGKK